MYKIFFIKKSIIRAMLGFSLLVGVACEPITRLDLVFTGKAAEPTDTSVQIEGVITDFNKPILEHGHCYALTPLPTINEVRTQLGPRTETGTFVSTLENLSPQTLYFIRAYLITEAEVIYGAQISVQTKPKSTLKELQVSTDGTSNIRNTSVTLRGTILTEREVSLQSYGHCWNTSNTVSLDNLVGKTELPALTLSNNRNFVGDLSSLAPAKLYYYRAYAVDNTGKRYYGTVKQFTTASN
jgi:hypothetical protein